MSLGFELVRRLDGLVYRFRQDGEFNGRPSFKRVDLDVWCQWVPERGWCTFGADGVHNGWSLTGRAAQGAFPPEGPWRSWKAGKSYLYDLRRADE
ncbi:hypothetical protein [Kitasatospora sp. SUK 42]|uniref:hypothetical protein n=1 Tax=Kitasatospora sp. SUK 42 TaxID=1588882 RepID=UPI0018CB767D|nr:hypothetical protein [Kitasatospora sp. SUK 42]MBV2152379.1 hypothetical protein [Kitasatospora sp. SUK 42]